METKELKTGRDDFVRHSEISGDGIRSTVAGIAGGITSVVVSTMKLADLPRLAADKPAGNPASYKNHSHDDDGEDWAGTRDLPTAVELATKGDYALLAKAQAMKAEACGVVEVQGFIRDVIGEYLDVGDYCAGVPECFFGEAITEDYPKALRLIVDLCSACVVEHKQMLLRAQKVTGLVLALESAGIDVELVASMVFTNGNRLYFELIPIKPLGTPVDRSVIAFWSGHPSALRRCFFRMQEANPYYEDFRHGYGTTIDAEQGKKLLGLGVTGFLNRFLPGDLATVYVPPLSRMGMTAESVLELGVNQVRAEGISLAA